MSGPANRTETSTTASLIKSWIGADYLRRAAEEGETPERRRGWPSCETMIRDSDNKAASRSKRGRRRVASIKRLISTCAS